MRYTLIILLPVEDTDRRGDAEHIEGNVYSSREKLKAKLPQSAEIYSLSEFMDLCNDQSIVLENFWVSYVTIEE